MSPRSPHRFFLQAKLNLTVGELVELSSEETHHLRNVLRLKHGAHIELFDAAGQAWLAEVLDGQGEYAGARLLEPIEIAKPDRPLLQMAVAVIKRNPMDWMIEKLSELGVDTLQPLLTSRSIGHGNIKPGTEPPERWTRLALAAAKQCGRNQPLKILPPENFAKWITLDRPSATGVFAHRADDSIRLGDLLLKRSDATKPLSIAIGPEGGWTPAEQEAFRQAGFQPVLLADFTLRTETAAIAAAAVCQAMFKKQEKQ